MEQTTYQPTSTHELHVWTDSPETVTIAAAVDGKVVADIAKTTDKQLKVLLAMAMTLQDALTKEYMRRHPDTKKEFNRLIGDKTNNQ